MQDTSLMGPPDLVRLSLQAGSRIENQNHGMQDWEKMWFPRGERMGSNHDHTEAQLSKLPSKERA